MPIYEFYCRECNGVFEILKSIGDKSHQCDVCKSDCEKLVSVPSMQPDTFWSGLDYPGLTKDKRVFTSKKDWENTMKANGRVVYEKGMHDKLPSNAKERQEFNAKKRDEKFGKQLRENIAEIVKERIK